MNEKQGNPFDRAALLLLLVVLAVIAYLAYQGQAQPININVGVEQYVSVGQPWATHVPSPLPTGAPVGAPTINDAAPVDPPQSGVIHHSKTRKTP